MEGTIQFRCPSCDRQRYRALSEVKTYNELVGAICLGCGRTVTDDDVRMIIRQVTVARLKKELDG